MWFIPVQNPDGTAWWNLPAGPAGSPEGLILDGPNPFVVGEENTYGPHGWASLELSDSQLHERVHAADAAELHQLTLP